jgi:gliding motility-associated-like protein
VVPAYGAGHWVLLAGSGLIGDTSAAVTPVSALGPGNNVFAWIVSDGLSQCNDTAQVIVAVQSAIIAIAGADRSLCADSVVLTATPPQFGSGYWQVVAGGGLITDTAQAKTTVLNLSPGLNTFRWTVVNGLCSDDAVVRITRLTGAECLEDIALPTGFTPNGDGRNDVFFVKGLADYEQHTLLVYNRWGNKVFEQSPYLNEWKGTNEKGELLPEGTYFVILQVAGIEKAFTGYLDLRR